MYNLVCYIHVLVLFSLFSRALSMLTQLWALGLCVAYCVIMWSVYALVAGMSGGGMPREHFGLHPVLSRKLAVSFFVG